ncbi:hemocytin [Trichogramma pretiosum]|uniref:hemocytin n=1 Tax=Trichogramma pretiosum TaxID=7493 RepID=UPI0006C9CEB5|nr:hemocytin [Trichogramma pretiosum]
MKSISICYALVFVLLSVSVGANAGPLDWIYNFFSFGKTTFGFDGRCYVEDGIVHHTFDDAKITDTSNVGCEYIFFQYENKVTVTLQQNCDVEDAEVNGCPYHVRIYYGNQIYKLKAQNKKANRLLTLESSGRQLELPHKVGSKVRFEKIDTHLEVFFENFKIFWNGHKLVQIDVKEKLFGKVSGTCGNYNDKSLDDYWKGGSLDAYRYNEDEKCEAVRFSKNPNSELSKIVEVTEEEKFCRALLSNPKYSECMKPDIKVFEKECVEIYQKCDKKDKRACSCDAYGALIKSCSKRIDISHIGWRDFYLCPMSCSGGQIYSDCAVANPTCSHPTRESPLSTCDEGCMCPENTVLHEGKCVSVNECPCLRHGKKFALNEVIKDDCNTCTCQPIGQWKCTNEKCPAKCSVLGDPHYFTFDGKKYDFQGKCSYYLVKGDDFNVIGVNGICDYGAVFGGRDVLPGEPTCTRSVKINWASTTIELMRDRRVFVDGSEVTGQLPVTVAGKAIVRHISSSRVLVRLPVGLEVIWDGVYDVNINVAEKLRGKVAGMCGTFTSTQKDDFWTPDGSTEVSVFAFANKWKVDENCKDVSEEPKHTCDAHPEKRAVAEKYCSVMKNTTFESCKNAVNPEHFYQMCLYDMCGCESSKLDSCLCPTISAYAQQCAVKGIVIPWRQKVEQCRVSCPMDQEYQVCGSSCTRSCGDVSLDSECEEQCVEGCNCPRGQSLDSKGNCVPIAQCPCLRDGKEFAPGVSEVRTVDGVHQVCQCAAGKWDCKPFKDDDPSQLDSSHFPSCEADKHLEMTPCEPAIRRTCRNMHENVEQSPARCQAGCVCQKGYVLESLFGSDEYRCIPEKDCPCYHGGRSYRDGETYRESCNTCQCNKGKWSCSQNVCTGVCSVWGDSHYTSFDGREYDFSGACEYVYAKGQLSSSMTFEVKVRNVACGTTGVTCSKTITLSIRNGDVQESVVLERGKELTETTLKNLRKIEHRRLGLFWRLSVKSLGLELDWDEGTRMHLRLLPYWKNKVQGLCGNYDDDQTNDYQTPSGGPAEARVEFFVDSWRVDSYCPAHSIDENEIDTCSKHPERKPWATKKCGVMLGETFEACHSAVAPDDYVKKCINDACACDDGGDCECLCTAISAYAEECNAHGIHIQWRKQKLCPLQCPAGQTYRSCIYSCPLESCENTKMFKDLIDTECQNHCFEGCEPEPCGKGLVYTNSSYTECQPRDSCKIPCIELNGQKYYEGERVPRGDCESCVCAAGKLQCIELDTPTCNKEPKCSDAMDADTIESIRFSSAFPIGTTPSVNISTEGAWRPMKDNQEQFVVYTFANETVELTGIETKGIDGMWTSAYKVLYSLDGEQWLPVRDSRGYGRIFYANDDDLHVKRNMFGTEIVAKHLKIIPIQWHLHLAMKIQLLGCNYRKYEVPCNLCYGVAPEPGVCHCEDDSKYWDGKKCVEKAACPCNIPSGQSSCDSCTCEPGGFVECKPKECPYCSLAGQRPTLNPETCECDCNDCPKDHKICPTNGDCIRNDQWCDGIQDCPDDEDITCPPPDPPKNIPPPEFNECPKSCPPDFRLVTEEEKKSGSLKYIELCNGMVCVPEKIRCLDKCPEGFQLLYDHSAHNQDTKIIVCNNHCVPTPPPYKTCENKGGHIVTFDKLRYSQEVCHHVLVKNADEKAEDWFIIVNEKCDDEYKCQKSLLVRFENHQAQLFADQHIILDDLPLSLDQIKVIGEVMPKGNDKIKITSVGGTLRIEYRTLKLSASIATNGDIVIEAPVTLHNKVVGMCGNFDFQAKNDLDFIHVEGSLNQTFADFWKISNTPECTVKACPRERKREAWKSCVAVREEPFSSVCPKSVNREHYISSCLESNCECLGKKEGNRDECRCEALSSFVDECVSADKNINLASWRTTHKCPEPCKPPFVHKPCFKNKCEQICLGLRQEIPCSVLDSVTCLSGCYCPDGMVRDKDSCVKVTGCRNCNCQAISSGKMITFDKASVPFEGSCKTHLFSRHRVDENEQSSYEVYVTNGECKEDTCIEAITVKYDSHLIHLKYNNSTQKVSSSVDSTEITKLPYTTSWLKLTEIPSGGVNMLITTIQLEIAMPNQYYGHMLNVPWGTFGGAMEGLCGDCDNNRGNDEGQKWLIESPPPFVMRDTCVPPTTDRTSKCDKVPTTEQLFNCDALVNDKAFQVCHAIHSYKPYLEECHRALMCGTSHCKSIAAYAEKCSQSGLCIDWRSENMCPFNCQDGKEYKACESRCSKTCDDPNGSSCKGPKIYSEGCFCPQGQVLHNGKCVSRTQCSICDNDGHVEGDVWTVNKCETCSCHNKTVNCTTKTCPKALPICRINEKLVLRSSEDDCCPVHQCLPDEPKPCEKKDREVPNCGYGQELKGIKDTDGCTKFICDCMPKDKCPPVSRLEKTPLEEGYEAIVNHSGCCPRMEAVCKPENCRPAPICPKYYKRVSERRADNECCPIAHSCEPPKDLCLLTKDDQVHSAKKIGERWQVDSCESCVCELDHEGAPRIACSKQSCLTELSHPDAEEYALRPVRLDQQCCPDFERVACKHNGATYAPGQVWYPNGEDKCTSMVCAEEPEHGLIKSQIVEQCPDQSSCELGYEYRHDDASHECCGKCVQTACVHDGQVAVVNETWFSHDHCIKSTCLSNDHSIQVQVTEEKCNEIDENEKRDYELTMTHEAGKCCPVYERVACKHNGHLYKPGDEWISSDDSCVSYRCVPAEDGKPLFIYSITQTCIKTCPKGSALFEPKHGQCCGECKQVACVQGDELYEPGQSWKSDNCTSHECVQKDDQLMVTTTVTACPKLNCKLEDAKYDDTGCCKVCPPPKPESITKECGVEKLNAQLTMHMIKENDEVHGQCMNKKFIEGLTECGGTCFSKTTFNPLTGNQDEYCKCCKPAKYIDIEVEMSCEDGHDYKKSISVPSLCSCEICPQHI